MYVYRSRVCSLSFIVVGVVIIVRMVNRWAMEA